jgi:alanine racemase
MSNPAKATIDLGALRSNYDLACSLAPGSGTIAVVKANAYGHGAVCCAQALEERVPAFGVSCIEEAMELRESGIRKPVLIMRSSLAPAEVQCASEQGLWLMAYEEAHVQSIVRMDLPAPVRVWLKVDTGMHRLGLDPGRLPSAYERLRESGNVVQPVVLATHFASADDTGSSFTRQQIEAFQDAARQFKAPVSLANSAGIMAWPGSHGDWNRPGIMLYGSSPMQQACAVDEQLEPVMHLASSVIALRRIGTGEAVGYNRNWRAARPSTIATVAIGYGDGYPRHAPNGTPVLVNGRRAPLAGRVSMDMITVDVTDLEAINAGDPVTLWGPGLPVNEVADAAGTIAYELLTRMTGRVALEYF